MRSFIAAAALISAVVASPHYGAGYPAQGEQPTSTPCSAEVSALVTPAAHETYPVEEAEPTPTPVHTPVKSMSKPMGGYPVETPAESPVKTPLGTETSSVHPTGTPVVPSGHAAETPCVSSTTIVVTVSSGQVMPSSMATPVASANTPVMHTGAPYPTGTPAAPTGPVGTGVPVPGVPSPGVPAPGHSAPGVPVPGVPQGTGSPAGPTPYPQGPDFTGAASSNMAAGFVAGVGAFAALFL